MHSADLSLFSAEFARMSDNEPYLKNVLLNKVKSVINAAINLTKASREILWPLWLLLVMFVHFLGGDCQIFFYISLFLKLICGTRGFSLHFLPRGHMVRSRVIEW